jgi:hypothetical protein
MAAGVFNQATSHALNHSGLLVARRPSEPPRYPSRPCSAAALRLAPPLTHASDRSPWTSTGHRSMREVVFYSPNKGASYGQAIRPRRVRQAFEAVQHFLSNCATSSPPERIRLVAYEATRWDEGAVAEACIARTVDRFGSPDQITGGGTQWPSGEPAGGGLRQWLGSPVTLEDMVDYLASGEPWPKQTLGPVDLIFSVDFQWLHPGSREIVAGQENGHFTADGSLSSNLLVTLGRRPFVQPDLWFPFPADSPELSRFLRAVEQYLPFELRPRHFRVATPTKNGKGYRFHKLVTSPLGPG